MEEMVNDFKTSLWKYYALFMMLLNKSRYVNVVARNHHLPQWDRLALLLFISVMRMRNKKLFSWMGVINAAAHWSSSGGNMPVLFGQKVTRDTMAQKLSNLYHPRSVSVAQLIHFLNKYLSRVHGITPSSTDN